MTRPPIMAPLFTPLLASLSSNSADAVILSFEGIEAIIGVPLPLKYRVESNNWSSSRYVHVR
jgi:hypothetical protein